MSVVGKCQAKGGPAMCRSDRCPERRALLDSLASSHRSVVNSLGSRVSKSAPPAAVSAQESFKSKEGVIFRTVHGSRLYGLANADSDEDYFTITKAAASHRSRRIRQKISDDGLDSLTMDFSSFAKLASEGSPQALEAMFSKQASVSEFESYRAAFRAGGPAVVERYLKTIKSMSLDDRKPFKFRRHALRLSLNLDELTATGRFDPTLSPAQVALVNRFAAYEGPAYYRELNRFQPFELNWEQWLTDKAEREALKSSGS